MRNEHVEVNLDGLPHQVEFWTDQTQGARIAMVGGLGTGKTRALVVKRLLMQSRNPGCNSMLVEPTYPMVRDILVPALEQIVRDELKIPIRINRTDHDVIWPASVGGGKTHLRSADDPDTLAGPNLSDVGIDEPALMVRDAFDRASLRARDPRAKLRQVYLTGSPEGMGWFAELFNDPAPPYRTIRARSWHPSIADYPKQIATTYAHSQWQTDCYLRGLFVPAFEGRCYGPFDRHKHVSANGALGYNSALELVLACDFNIDSMRWLVMQFHPDQIQVLDEIALGTGGTVAHAAAEFGRRYAIKHGAEKPHSGTVRVVGDASGKARSQTGSICYEDLMRVVVPYFRSVVLDVPSANPIQRDRVDTVNFHLSGAGRTVLIHPRCKELIADLEQNAWKQGTAEIVKAKNPPESLRTHAGDAFGYALWQLAPARKAQRPSVVLHSQKAADRNRDNLLGMRF